MNKKFGPIYAKASNDKIKEWCCIVTEKEEQATLDVTHGYTDGEKVTNSKIIKIKNIGKSNVTTPWTQGLSEAQSKYNKKVDEGYVTDIKNVDVIVELPMLAQKFTEREKYVQYPCVSQPKLNGVRCISKIINNKVNNISRQGKLYTTLHHLDNSIKEFINFTGNMPDGEIFHPDWTFQEIIRALKKEREETKELEYWIYDIVNTNKVYIGRDELISDFFTKYSKEENRFGFMKYNNLVYVPNEICEDKEDVLITHKQWSSYNFEGSILRNCQGLYVLNQRSNDLLKLKDFLDNEYEIVGAHSGSGDDIDTVIFECKTEEDLIFSVRPKGSRERRREWLKDINNLLGKKLTVRYQTLSDAQKGYTKGVPIFPVGICIRDYE